MSKKTAKAVRPQRISKLYNRQLRTSDKDEPVSLWDFKYLRNQLVEQTDIWEKYLDDSVRATNERVDKYKDAFIADVKETRQRLVRVEELLAEHVNHTDSTWAELGKIRQDLTWCKDAIVELQNRVSEFMRRTEKLEAASKQAEESRKKIYEQLDLYGHDITNLFCAHGDVEGVQKLIDNPDLEGEQRRFEVVYGAFVVSAVDGHNRQYKRLPNDQELQVIVRTARGHAGEVEEAWKRIEAMQRKAIVR